MLCGCLLADGKFCGLRGCEVESKLTECHWHIWTVIEGSTHHWKYVATHKVNFPFLDTAIIKGSSRHHTRHLFLVFHSAAITCTFDAFGWFCIS